MFLAFAVHRPLHTFVIFVLTLFAGVAEGIGLLSLLPLISGMQAINDGSEAAAQTEGNQASEIMAEMFEFLNLDHTFETALTVIVCALILKTLLVAGSNMFVARSAAGLVRDIRMRMLNAIGAAQWAYFVEQSPGRLANIISTEIDMTSRGMMRSIQLLSTLVQVSVILGASFLVNWRFTLLAVGAALVIALVVSSFVTMARKAGGERTTVLTSMMDSLVDGIQGFKALKSMAREKSLIGLLRNDTDALMRVTIRRYFANISINALPEMIVTVFVGIILYFSTIKFGLSFSEAIVTVAIGYQAMKNISEVQKGLQQIVGNHAAYELTTETQARATALKEEFSGTKQPSFEKEIRFRNVSFAYEDTPVLDDVSLSVPARGVTALIGPSGAGKSTVIDLVLGLRHAPGQEILLDGTPILDVDIAAWRGMIGYVPQDVRLFDRSIAENVTLNEPNVTREDVEFALKQAGLGEWIASLPNGIDNRIGQSGQMISGGQRQRIALARALVHRPRLLLLDEATSALDPDTEQQICKTLGEIARDRSVLAISHQSGILSIADTVYMIESGRVRQMDKHSGGPRQDDKRLGKAASL